MADLVTVSPEAIGRVLSGVLPRFPEVAGAVLFGSALGECRPDSDIDVGLILCPSVAEPHGWGFAGLESRVERELGTVEGHPFEVTVLRRDRPLFSFKVWKEGRPLYLRDEEAVLDFVERVSRSHAELAPRHRRALREVLKSS